jgi:hypothetical protein
MLTVDTDEFMLVNYIMVATEIFYSPHSLLFVLHLSLDHQFEQLNNKVYISEKYH